MGAAIDDVVDKDEFIDCAPSHIIHLPSEGKRGNHFTLALLLFRSSHHHSAIASHRISSSRFLDTHARTWTMYCWYYIFFLPLFMPVYIFVTLSWQFLFKQNIFSYICSIYIDETMARRDAALPFPNVKVIVVIYFWSTVCNIFSFRSVDFSRSLVFAYIFSYSFSTLSLPLFSLSLFLFLLRRVGIRFVATSSRQATVIKNKIK